MLTRLVLLVATLSCGYAGPVGPVLAPPDPPRPEESLPVFESPLLASPVLESPIFQSPMFESPMPSLEDDQVVPPATPEITVHPSFVPPPPTEYDPTPSAPVIPSVSPPSRPPSQGRGDVTPPAFLSPSSRATTTPAAFPSATLSSTPSAPSTPAISLSSTLSSTPSTVPPNLPTPEQSQSPEPTEDTLSFVTAQPSFEVNLPFSLEPAVEPSVDPARSEGPESSLPPEDQLQTPPQTPQTQPTVPPGQRTPCFPASATVQLSDGTIKTMQQLSIGDEVLVGGGQYSPVHMFTHRIHDTWQEFVSLTTSSGRVLKATDGHFVYVENRLRPARDVRVGDRLPTAEGTWTTVTHVRRVVERGLYNPQTLVGTIVVDGIRASVYTEAVKPAIAHAALLPLRAAFSLFGLSTQCGHNGFPETVPQALRSMVAVAK